MQRWGISGAEAVNFIRNKRHVVQPNRGFCEQLNVWENCRYDVFTEERAPKEAYELWRKGMESERAEMERERAEGERERAEREREDEDNAEVDDADTGAA